MLNNTLLHLQNLKCGGCAITIVTKLSSIENITNLKVNLDENIVSFSYLNDTEVLKVKEKLKTLEYPSIEETNSLTSRAKSFVSCATGKLSK